MEVLKLLKAKLNEVNWECVQEALQLVAIFFILWMALFQVAYADQVIDQPQHDRMILFEGWHGGNIVSDYNEVVGTVRFNYCRSNGKATSCELIAEPVAITDIQDYDIALLMNLQSLRNKMAEEVDQSLWKFISGDSKSNPDIQALDFIISELHAGGIKKLVLLTEENIREESVAVSSPEVADRVVEAMKKGFGAF